MRASDDYTDAEIEQARADIRDDIVQGKTVRGFDFAACLDCYLNDDSQAVKFSAEFCRIVGELYGDGYSTAGTWLEVLALAERIVERYVPEDAIYERIDAARADRAEIEAEARSDAQRGF